MRFFTPTLVTLFGLTATVCAQDPGAESVGVSFHGCNVIQRGIITKAHQEFNRMCPANVNLILPGSTYKYKIDWKSGPAIDFFGSAFTNQRFRSAIQSAQIPPKPTANISSASKLTLPL